MCTSDAVRGGFCSQHELGRFILDLPEGKSVADTSFWSARVSVGSGSASTTISSGFWDNPQGNPSPPASKNSSPWRRQESHSRRTTHENEIRQNNDTSNTSGILTYQAPIQYTVTKTGYYCVGESCPCFHSD